MAGIQGMGGPSKVKAPVPAALNPDISNVDNIAQIPDLSVAPEMDPMQDPDVLAILGQQTQPQEIDPMQDPDVLAILGQSAAPAADSQVADFATETEAIVEDSQPKPWFGTEDAFNRFKVGFAGSEKQQLETLNQIYGKDNVKKSKSGFLIKKDGKWKRFDSDQVELINDTLDLMGIAVEQGATEAATAGGLALASGQTVAAPLTGGASLFAVPGTIAGARAAGGALGTVARQFIGENLLGIPPENIKDKASEAAINGALNAVGGRLFDWAGGRLADRAARKAQEKLMAPNELLKAEIKDMEDAANLLKTEFGFDQPLALQELAPSSPAAKVMYKEISNLPEVSQINSIKEQAFEGSIKSYLESISSFGKETLNIGNTFAEQIKKVRKNEGELIGGFRKKVAEMAGDRNPLPVPSLKQGVEEIMSGMGFQNIDGRLRLSPDDNALSDEVQKKFVPQIQKVYEKIVNSEGRLTMKEINGLYDQFNGIYAQLLDRGSDGPKDYLSKVAKLRGQIRNEFIDKSGVILGDVEQGAYKKSLGRFKEIAEAQDALQRVVANDNIQSSYLAKQIFSKGKDGRDMIAAAKTVLADSPEIWSDMVGQYFTDVVAKNSVGGKVKWDKATQEIANLGPEVLNDMLGSGTKKTFDAFAKIGRTLEESRNFARLSIDDQTNIVKNLAVTAAEGSGFTGSTAIVSMLTEVDKEKLLYTVLQKEGIDKFLARSPEKYKPFLKKALGSYLDFQDKAIKLSPVPMRILGAEKMREEKEEAP
jgi:hypothetical protein